MLNKEILLIEEKIGYTFNNTDLLEAAFEASIAEDEYLELYEAPSYSNHLIYLAQSALDSAAIVFLAKFYAVKDDGFAFVKDMKYIDDLHLALQDRYLFSKRIVELGLDSFMYKHKKLYSRAEVEELRANLFEAIIGAIVVDSDYDMQAISKAYTAMLEPMEVALTIDGINYYEEVAKWLKEKYDKELAFDILKTSKRYKATLIIPNPNDIDSYHEHGLSYSETEAIYGYGFTEDQAKRDACRHCFYYLRDINKLNYSILTKNISKIKEIVDSRSEGRAIAIINSLVENELLSRPIVSFRHDVYRKEHYCSVRVEEYSYEFLGSGRSVHRAKMDAMKQLVTQIYNDIYNKKHKVNRVAIENESN